MLDLDLQGAHVLITGASGGIGLETTRLFLEQGAKVTAHYNASSEPLQPYLSNPSVFLGQDLTSESSVKSLFESATKTLGPVYIAVINHGIWIKDDVALKDMSLERWNKTMSTNLTSSFLVAREFLKGLELATASHNGAEKDKEMIDQASIVFVGSSAGKYGEAMHADYSASKSAMMYGLTLTLKNEIVKIIPKGRVNCVAPGWVHTPLATEALKDPMVVYRALATTPLKKVAVPFDVATQIAILASAKVSGHVTGHIVNVMGGMEGRLLNLQEDLA
ncbi:nad dependent epimerase dehydratase family protein [Moniliophthora roreri]|uniref:Nad dependent epimerase dehydratase family protein n=1 Tax=Moniliophthora roreri TaxID=221103 RepID=A0A0W0F2P2_MONRR|nr:nad dependent epimerase dehydratase family protein [Moniliophthora roreri]